MSERAFKEGDVVCLASNPSMRMTVEGFVQPVQQMMGQLVQMQAPPRRYERPVNVVWFKGQIGPCRETFEEGALRKSEVAE